MNEAKPTIGQRRVRVNFNPGKDDYVNDIKVAAANLIDLIDHAVASPKFTDEDFGEWKRLKALAITAIEEGAMWGVKAATI